MHVTKVSLAVFGFVFLVGCEQSDEYVNSELLSNSAVELQRFVQAAKSNLVFVEGGDFLMGDFGSQYAPERAPYDWDDDSKPLHKIELSSYSVGRFKVSNAEFQFYLKYNGLKIREKGTVFKSVWDDINSAPNTPAHIDWYEADKYCKWLASVSDTPFALPTEAQWEYAARSRGQFLMVATNDGTYKAEPRVMRTEMYSPKGINISSNGDRTSFAREMGWSTGYSTPLPVDMFPPNPLGVYSMSDNGYEWVMDWYDPNYYKYSPTKDPQGPEKPVFRDHFDRFTKVARGQDYANPYWGGGVNVHRRAQDPYGRFSEDETISLGSKTMRCVVNSPTPVSL